MNADNVVDTNFLEVVNNTYASGSNAIQTHRIYQERPSNVSILNAITDEINNSILRAGHVNLGLSASLNGSGTAIDFTWFKEKQGIILGFNPSAMLGIEFFLSTILQGIYMGII